MLVGLPVVPAKLEFRQVAVKVLYRDLVQAACDAPFQQTPIAVDCPGVDIAHSFAWRSTASWLWFWMHPATVPQDAAGLAINCPTEPIGTGRRARMAVYWPAWVEVDLRRRFW
jgi:hypothetical protein